MHKKTVMERRNILEFLPEFRELFALTQTDIANELNHVLSLKGEKVCTQSYINKLESGASVTIPKIEVYLIDKLYYIDLQNYRDVREFSRSISKLLDGSDSFSLSHLFGLKTKEEIFEYLIQEIENNSFSNQSNSVKKAFIDLLQKSITNIDELNEINDAINPTENISKSVDFTSNGEKILNMNNLAYFVLFTAYFHINYLVLNKKTKSNYSYEFKDLNVSSIDKLYTYGLKDSFISETFNKITLLNDWNSKTNATKGKLCNTLNMRWRFLSILFNEFQDYHHFIIKFCKSYSEIIKDKKLSLLANCMDNIYTSIDENNDLSLDDLNTLLNQLENFNYSYSNIIPYIYYISQELLPYYPNKENIDALVDSFNKNRWFSKIPFVNSDVLRNEILSELNYISEQLLHENEEGYNLFELIDKMFNIKTTYENLSKLNYDLF